MDATHVFTEPEPGLFLVAYEDGRTMSPALQEPLVAAVERAARQGPVGVCFRVQDSIPLVKLEVPAFWIDVTKRPELRLRAMAIVSRSAGVQLAAKGFSLSNRIRGIPVAVQAFTDLEQAWTWMRQALRSPAAGGAGARPPIA